MEKKKPKVKVKDTQEEVELEIGDHVKFLRSADKAVELTGVVTKIEGNSVDIRLDTEHETFETAHLDDVTVLTKKEEREVQENKAAAAG